MIYEAEKYALGFECGIHVNDRFWFSDMRENALYYWGREGVNYVGEFPYEAGERLYIDVRQYEDKLVFVPALANSVSIYDMIDKEFRNLQLPFERETDLELFSTSIIWKNYMYFFPSYFDGIVKLDLWNGTMEVLEDLGLQNSALKGSLLSPYFSKEYCQIDDKLYIPFMRNGVLLEFDLTNDSGRIIDLGTDVGFTSIARNGEDFWLCSLKRNDKERMLIIRWNRLSNAVVSYSIDLLPNRYIEPVGSMCGKEYCWIFFTHPDRVLKIHLDTGEISKEELFANINSVPLSVFSIGTVGFIYCQKNDKGVLLCDGLSSKVIWFEPDTGVLKSWTLKMPKERRPFYKNTISKLYYTFLQEEKNKDIHHESSCFGPIDMLEDLVE